jgi:hypothetical protein
MFIRRVKFRGKIGAVQLIWCAGKVYNTLVRECTEMTIWKTEEIGAYCDEGKCHMTERWPFK